MSIITWRATELLNRTGRSGQGGGGGGGADARKTKPSGRCCSGNLQHKGAHTGQRGGARGGSAWAVSGGRLTDQINYTIKECRHEMKMSVPVRKFNQEIGFLLSVPPRVGVRAKGSAAGLWQAHQLRSVSAASSLPIVGTDNRPALVMRLQSNVRPRSDTARGETTSRHRCTNRVGWRQPSDKCLVFVYPHDNRSN